MLQLVLFYNDHLEAFNLDRELSFGRPSRISQPDIPSGLKYISRKHGLFQIQEGRLLYTNISETNGTFHNGSFLNVGETCTVSEGDIFIIRPKIDPEVSGLLMLVRQNDTRGKEWRMLELSDVESARNPRFLSVVTTYYPEVIQENLYASLEKNSGSPSGWTLIQKDPARFVTVNHIRCSSYDLNVNDVVSIEGHLSVIIDSGRVLWYQVDDGAQDIDQILSNPEFGRRYFHLRLDTEDDKKGAIHPGHLKLRCKRCGSEVFEGERFCIECGAPSAEFEIVN